jgi:hypothetical protein
MGGMGQPAEHKKAAYLFLDEGGNFDFSTSGTKYFTLTSVLTLRPFNTDSPLTEPRFDLIEDGLDKEYFHASEDEQATRNNVFEIIAANLDAFLVDGIVVEKRKAAPPLRDEAVFYPKMLGELLQYVVRRADPRQWSEMIVITDRIPVNKKRKAIEKAIKMTLPQMLPDTLRFRILHHDSKSCCGLQVADYFNWAIYREWDRADSRSLDLVRRAVRSQRDVFRRRTKAWF